MKYIPVWMNNQCLGIDSFFKEVKLQWMRESFETDRESKMPEEVVEFLEKEAQGIIDSYKGLTAGQRITAQLVMRSCLMNPELDFKSVEGFQGVNEVNVKWVLRGLIDYCDELDEIRAMERSNMEVSSELVEYITEKALGVYEEDVLSRDAA